jgi:predicted phosphodiesterase
LAAAVVPACARTTPLNTARAVPNLLAGAKWQYTTDNGRTWADSLPAVKPGETLNAHARTTFEVADPFKYLFLEFAHGAYPRIEELSFTLNGAPVPVPIPGLYYETIGTIPSAMLRVGQNTIAAHIVVDNRPPPDKPESEMFDINVALATDLAGLTENDLRFVGGPVMGPCGKNGFTVSCRTNMPVPVTLTVAAEGKDTSVRTSARGLLHRFHVDRLDPSTQWTYALSVDFGSYHLPGVSRPLKLLPGGNSTRFIVAGDSRTNPTAWAQVAAAVSREKPDFVVFTGDMCSAGRNDWQMIKEFLLPAENLLATTPFFIIYGNHEEKDSPLVQALFPAPGDDPAARKWTLEVAGALLIGIDGRFEDWSRGSDNAQWLDDTLSASKSKFIFFFTHYPGYSSDKYGKLDAYGRLNDTSCQRTREVVIPILTKHKVTALIAGHAHGYERSDLPGGLAHITAAGAGAPFHPKVPGAETQNPYSKVFETKLHYGVIEIKGDSCSFRAITPDGKSIDSMTFQPRQP